MEQDKIIINTKDLPNDPAAIKALLNKIEEEQRQRDEEERRIEDLKKAATNKLKNVVKEEESEEDYERAKWHACMAALEVLKDTDMKFHRDSQPRYFRKLQTKVWDRKTNIEYLNTEVKFYPPSTLSENWLKLKTVLAKDMFRTMVEGGIVSVKNPDTNEWVTYDFPGRIYDKITNTLNKVDEKTFNMLDLGDKLNPNYKDDEVPTCPPIVKALLYSISGNEITYDEEKKCWMGNKDENTTWFEKWLYGTVHADIGNNMASFPVIYGGAKIGKNALFDKMMRHLLGKDARFTGTWDIIHGNFDGYKLGKVFMFIDEVPERGSWEILKNMTGSTDSFVKQKYGPEFVIDNTVRYAIGTNEEVYPLPVENGPQMMRVSPIKASKKSTFAENAVKIMDAINGENYSRNLLKATNDTLDVDNLSNFEVGDILLRGAWQIEWTSREACQQLLNYLDYTYKSKSGDYSLAPLRSADWVDMVKERSSTIQQVVDYVVDQSIDTITTQELYEIYKVLQQERSDAMKKMASFSQHVADVMVRNNYVKHDRAYLRDGVRSTIYTTTGSESFKNYVIDIDKFIIELTISNSNTSNNKVRKLRYKDNAAIGSFDEVNNDIGSKLALLSVKRANS